MLPPRLDVLRVLWKLNHQLEVASSEMLRTIGVTAQQRMLLRVVQHLQPVSAGTLAEALHVHPGTLSAALRRLERRDLVTRRRSADDARRILVALTARGRRIAARADGTVEHAVQAAVAQSDPRSVEATLALLHAVADELRPPARGGEAAPASRTPRARSKAN